MFKISKYILGATAIIDWIIGAGVQGISIISVFVTAGFIALVIWLPFAILMYVVIRVCQKKTDQKKMQDVLTLAFAILFAAASAFTIITLPWAEYAPFNASSVQRFRDLSYGTAEQEDTNAWEEGSDILQLETDKDIANASQNGAEYQNTKYNFALRFPQGWEQSVGTQPHVVWKATKGNSAVAIQVREFATNFGEVSGDLLEDMKDEIIASVQAELPTAEVVSSEVIIINEYPFLKARYEGVYSQQDVDFHFVMEQLDTVKDNVVISLTVTSSQSDFPRIEQAVMQTINSFRFTDRQAALTPQVVQNNSATAEKTIRAYYAALQDRELEKALIYLSPAERSRSMEVEMMQRFYDRIDSQSPQLLFVTRDKSQDDVFDVSYSYTFIGAERSCNGIAKYFMKKLDDGWYIDGLDYSEDC